MIDHLTQCASLKALNEALESAQSPKLFLIDIRQFKAFNIRYGDEGGNAILRALASTLQHFCHEQEMRLFRVRDDQFALLIDCPFELSKMERLIFALSDVLKNIAIDYHDETITLETAIGISFDHFNALEKAQKALQVAKAEQQPFVTFSEFANVLLSENEEAIETAIKEAIAQEKLVFHLQAVVNVFNQPFYHELLLRLADTQTLQSPKLFLKIAKERGFYGELFHSIVQKAKGLAEELSTPVALNLFDTDLLDETLFSELLNLPLDNVFLEVHYYHVASPQALNQAFQRLKEQGATIILDSVMEIGRASCRERVLRLV